MVKLLNEEIHTDTWTKGGGYMPKMYIQQTKMNKYRNIYVTGEKIKTK